MTRSLAIFFVFIGIVASSTADRLLEEAMTIWSKPQYSGPERIWLRKQAVLFSEIFKTMPGLDDSQRTLSLSSFIQFITSAIRELDRRQTYRLAVALEEVRHRRDSRKSVKGICRAAIRAEFDGSIVMTPEGASRVWDFDYDSLIIDLYLNILEEVPEIDLLSFQGLLRDPIRQNALRVALRIVTQNTDLFSDQWKEQLSCLSEISTSELVEWADVLTLVQETTDRLSVQYQVDMGIVYVPLWMTRIFIEYPTRLRLLAEGMIQLSKVPEFNEISASLARAFASPESMNLILSTCLPTKYKTKIYYYAGSCEIYFLRHRVREFITDLILNRVDVDIQAKSFRAFANLAIKIIMGSSDPRRISHVYLPSIKNSISDYRGGIIQLPELTREFEELMNEVNGEPLTEILFVPEIDWIPLDSAVNIALHQALVEFGMFYESNSFGLGNAVIVEVNTVFPSLSSKAKIALKQFLRDAVGDQHTENDRTSSLWVVADIAFRLASRFGIKILHLIDAKGVNIDQLRLMVSNWIFNSDFTGTRRQSMIEFITNHEGREIDITKLDNVARAVKYYTLTKKDDEVSEYLQPGSFILSQIWDNPRSAIVWMKSFGSIIVRVPLHQALGERLRENVSGVNDLISSFVASPYPLAVMQFDMEEFPRLYRSHLSRLAGLMEAYASTDQILRFESGKFFSYFGLSIPHALIAWMANRNEFTIDEDILEEFSNLTTIWRGIIENIPVDQSAEVFYRYEKKFMNAQTFLKKLSTDINRGIDKGTLQRELAKTCTNLIETFA